MNVLEALTSYLRFGDEDAQILSAMGPFVRPAFPQVVDRFYEAVHRTPEALAVFEGGAAQIERQKGQLRGWLEGLFSGVYDEAYYELRARIGRTHVRINLDQRFMFAAMNVVRRELHAAIAELPWSDEERRRGSTAIDKLCDIELAVMLETYREDQVRKIQDRERLATVGQVAASIGHELRNPLAVMRTSVQLLERRVAEDERAGKHLAKIGAQISLSNAIISDLLELARDRPPVRQGIDAVEIVGEAIGAVPRPAAIALELRAPPRVDLHADPGQLRQVLVNTILNAVQAVGGLGQIVVTVEERAASVAFIVDDSGPGLSHEVQRRLFEPLFTTRPTGTGLGLALCRRIVDKHGGTIAATNRAEGGARFTVEIPRAKAAEGAA